MPLSPYERFYESIQTLSDLPEKRDHHVALDAYPQPDWLHDADRFTDYLSSNLPSDESIMEAMSVKYLPWQDDLHRSSFFPDIQDMEDHLSSIISTMSPRVPKPSF